MVSPIASRPPRFEPEAPMHQFELAQAYRDRKRPEDARRALEAAIAALGSGSPGGGRELPDPGERDAGGSGSLSATPRLAPFTAVAEGKAGMTSA